MSEVLGLAAVLGVLAAGIVTVATALARPMLARLLARLGLGHRRAVTQLLIAGPLLVVGLVPLLCLLPSIAAIALPTLDHCLAHTDHVLHLCFVHLPAVSSGNALLGPGLVALVSVLVLGAAARRVMVSRAAARRFGALGASDESDQPFLLPTERCFAFTLGLLRPRVYVSEGLRRALDPRQWDVVLAHERAHARRRDPLRSLCVRAVSILHVPAVRRALIAEYELAVEQLCDHEAAARCGDDRLLVADTLLALERLANMPTPAGASPARDEHLTARVEALLCEPDPTPTRVQHLGWLAAAALVALADPAHHVAEHLLGHWLM